MLTKMRPTTTGTAMMISLQQNFTRINGIVWNCVYPCKTKSDYIILYRSILTMLGHNIDQRELQKRGFCSSWKLYNIFFAVAKHSYLTYSYHVSICILSCIMLHGTSNGSASRLPASHHGCLFHCGPNQEELAIDAIQLMLAGENSRFRKGAVCLGNKTLTPQIKDCVHQIIACKFISQVGCAWRLIRKKKAKRYNTSPWSNNQDFCLCRNDKTHR